MILVNNQTLGMFFTPSLTEMLDADARHTRHPNTKLWSHRAANDDGDDDLFQVVDMFVPAG